MVLKSGYSQVALEYVIFLQIKNVVHKPAESVLFLKDRLTRKLQSEIFSVLNMFDDILNILTE